MSSANAPDPSDGPDDNLELGRRLVAALLSYHYRLVSVDYTLKRYIPQNIDPSWNTLAHDLLRAMLTRMHVELTKRP